jgi:hypothetical protein
MNAQKASGCSVYESPWFGWATGAGSDGKSTELVRVGNWVAWGGDREPKKEKRDTL